MKPAIVLSGHTMALGVVRALGSMGVPVVIIHYDQKDIAHTSRFIKHSLLAPNPEHHEAKFIDVLLGLKNQYAGGVIFPVSDETVVAVARNIEQLKRHFIIACPEWDIARNFIEKKNTYALADAHGVPAPKTVIPGSISDVEAKAIYSTKNSESRCFLSMMRGSLSLFTERLRVPAWR